MEQFYGVAAAIRPDKQKLQVSLVSGSKKNNLYIVETQALDFKVQDIKSVRQAYNALFFTIEKALKLQREEKTRVELPIIHGWPIEFEIEAWPHLYNQLCTLYSPFISHVLPPAPQLPDKSFFHHLFSGYLQSRFSMNESEISTGIRRFSSENNVSTSINDKISIDFDEVDSQLSQWLEAADKGSEVFKDQLIELSKISGKKFAQSYVIGIQNKSLIEPRFYMVWARESAHARSLAYTLPAQRPYLKEAFTKAFLGELGIDYNICIKFPSDKSDPGYANVVSTVIADQIDMYYLGKIEPECILLAASK